jgi:hypothetical protein
MEPSLLSPEKPETELDSVESQSSSYNNILFLNLVLSCRQDVVPTNDLFPWHFPNIFYATVLLSTLHF